MEGQTTRYAMLRDGARWDGVTTEGLEADAGGALVLAPGATLPHAAAGLLEVGPLPLDAGERAEWERVVVEAEVPEKTSVTLEVFAHSGPSVAAADMRWKSLPTLDALVPAAEEWGAGGGLRFLWVRVRLRGDGGSAGPRLLQVSAATAGETYLDYLPAFYRRDEETRRFLGRWLGLFRAELGDLETALEQMPRGFEPALAREEHLPWLSGWLAFDLPFGRGAEASRRLLGRAARLYERRGTPAGLAEFIELYTGVRPRVVEAFAERKIWQLDLTSALGVDTVLPATSPGGMVVPDPAKPPTVGEVLVGASGPLPRDEYGETLFNETAHLFRVVVPAAGMDVELRQAIAGIIEAEKPAHTEYQLCVESEEQEQEESRPREGEPLARGAAAARPAGETDGVSPAADSGSGAEGVVEPAAEGEPAEGFETSAHADAAMRVESVEFLDARSRVAGTLERGEASAQFHASTRVNAIRVRFSRPVDLSTVVSGGKRENPAGFSFLLQANWSRRAEKYVPGAIFLDSRDTHAVRFVPTTAHGHLRPGRYTATLFGGGGDPARPAVRDMNGQELRGPSDAEGGNFVFRFQITA